MGVTPHDLLAETVKAVNQNYCTAPQCYVTYAFSESSATDCTISTGSVYTSGFHYMCEIPLLTDNHSTASFPEQHG